MSMIAALLFGVVSAGAQGTPEPIAIGENRTGTLSQTTPIAAFALLVDQPQPVNVRVFAISPGLAPLVRVLDAGGNLLAGAPNNGGQTSVQIAGLSLTPGVSRIEVSSATPSLGDFLINIEGQVLEPPLPLPPGQIVSDSVDPEIPLLRYAFRGSLDQPRWLFVQSLADEASPVVTLKDEETNETLAMSSPRLGAIHMKLPADDTRYVVEIQHSGSLSAEPFLICLALETNLLSCPLLGNIAQPTEVPPVVIAPSLVPSLVPTELPPLPTNVCSLASASGQTINVRSAPTTQSVVVTTMSGATIATVIGRLPDNSWYYVQLPGATGWVSGTVARLGGPCSIVPAITPVSAATLPPTATGSVTTTATPAATATATTTATATATSPGPVPTLNFSLPPVFGSTALTSGFVPDPFTVGITAGGPVNANYLGSGCFGYTTSAPSFSVNYTSGAFPLLRFYFIGSADTTMIINSPSGTYRCIDDSYGTLNPTLDFNSPGSGRYDVWIATFNPGASIAGTLYVTENSANHP
jgi:hypothetical protein